MMNGVYENIDHYNPSKKRKILTVFDDMIVDIITNKKFQTIIKELFIRCKKLNISLVLITVLFSCSKRCQIKFNTLFDYEINNKRKLQNIAINHSAEIDYKDFIKVYRECIRKPYFFSTIDTALPASDPLRFFKKFF